MPKRDRVPEVMLALADLMESDTPLSKEQIEEELTQAGIQPVRLRDRFYQGLAARQSPSVEEQEDGKQIPIEAGTLDKQTGGEPKLAVWANHWLDRFLIPDSYIPALDAVRAFRKHIQLSDKDNRELSDLQVELRSATPSQREANSQSFVELLSRAFLSRFGLDCGKRLPAIAAELGIEILYRSAESYDGVLLRIPESHRAVIVINSAIREESRQRFTLAHELAHYLLPGHPMSSTPCSKGKIESWDPELYRAEQDANRFAAEVLMPYDWIAPFLTAEPSIASIKSIAMICNTSLSASAVRLIELSRHRAAVVWSHKDSVIWYKSSRRFGRWIKKGKLATNTVASRLLAKHEAKDGPTKVPALSWLFERGLRSDAVLWEHSVPINKYDSVLTLLLMRESVRQANSAP